MRDKRDSYLLRKSGWHVATVWECQLKRNANAATTKVARMHS